MTSSNKKKSQPHDEYLLVLDPTNNISSGQASSRTCNSRGRIMLVDPDYLLVTSSLVVIIRLPIRGHPVQNFTNLTWRMSNVSTYVVHHKKFREIQKKKGKILERRSSCQQNTILYSIGQLQFHGNDAYIEVLWGAVPLDRGRATGPAVASTALSLARSETCRGAGVGCADHQLGVVVVDFVRNCVCRVQVVVIRLKILSCCRCV